MHQVLVIIFLCAIASVQDAHGRQSAFDPPSTESSPFTDTDLHAMRDAARDALFAMQDGEKHWQPQKRSPSESLQEGGETAFCCWALLESGCAAQDPRLAAPLAALTQPMDGTYAVASRVLARSALVRKSLKNDAAIRRALEMDVAWLVAGFSKKAASWGYAQEPSTRLADNSIRQFVALALLEADRVGVKSPAALWRELCDAICNAQDASGAWTYQGRGNPRGSIVAGFVAALEGALQLDNAALDARARQRVQLSVARATEWLAARFDAQRNPGSDEWWIFWIFALERAAHATGSAEIGAHDWLAESCDALSTRLFVRPTQRGGAWTVRDRLPEESGGTRVRAADLATALLFLDRALRPHGVLVWTTAEGAPTASALAREIVAVMEERDESRLTWSVASRDNIPDAISARAGMLFVARDRAQSLTPAQLHALIDHATRGGIVVIDLPSTQRDLARTRCSAALGGAFQNASLRGMPLETLDVPHTSIAFVDIGDDTRAASRAAALLAQLATPFQHDAFPWPSFALEHAALPISRAVHLALVSSQSEALDSAWTVLSTTPPITRSRATDAAAIDALELPCLALVHGAIREDLSPAVLSALRAFVHRGGLVLFESPFGKGDFARRSENAWLDGSAEPSRLLTTKDFDQVWPELARDPLRWRPAALVGLDLQAGATNTALRLRGTFDARGIAAIFSREDLSFGLLDVPHAACIGMQPRDARRAVRALLELAVTRAAKGAP